MGFNSTASTIVNDGSFGNLTHEIIIVVNDKLPIDLGYRIESTVNNALIKKAFSSSHVIRKNEKEQVLKFQINKKQLKASGLKNFGLKIIVSSNKSNIKLLNSEQSITLYDSPPLLPSTRRAALVGFNVASGTIVNDGSAETLTHEITLFVNGDLPFDVECNLVSAENNIVVNSMFSGDYILRKNNSEQTIRIDLSRKELEQIKSEEIRLNVVPFNISNVGHLVDFEKQPYIIEIINQQVSKSKLGIISSVVLGLIALFLTLFYMIKKRPWLNMHKRELFDLGGQPQPKAEPEDDSENEYDQELEDMLSESESDIVKEKSLEVGVIPPSKFTVVPTFYGTDRALSGSGNIDKFYGSDRGSLSFGICEVSIPKTHSIGEIEAPLWGVKWLESENKHIVLRDIQVLQEKGFIKTIREKIEISENKSALIFVHGFNVSFADAAKRTAQIAYDLKFQGVPLFYSWPSHANPLKYTPDESNIGWTQANMQSFLETVLKDSQAENIYIIAHSMGTRALSRSIADIVNNRPELKSKIQEVILSAPDIDSDVFKRDIAPKIVSSGSRLTLYASSEDKALMASKGIHQSSRAGESGESIVILKGMSTIDATGMDTGFLKHSYYGDSRFVLNDIHALINGEKYPEDRFNLEKVESSKGVYFEFRK